MVKRSLQSLGFVFALLGASCASVPSHPRLGLSEVVQLADAEARRHGKDYDPLHFQHAAAPHYDTTDDSWWLHYKPKSGSGLRYDFEIRVEDKTKKSYLVVP